jgi:ribokinase
MRHRGDGVRQAFVFGNAAIDEVFIVRNLPAPGESVLGTAGDTSLGGKGANQAIALARTGVPTTFVAAVGLDRYARNIRETLGGEALDVILLERSGLATDRSIIFAKADGDNVIVTTNDCAASMTLAECVSVLAAAQAGDAVLLQGNLRADVTAALCRECHDRGLYLVLNPSPFDKAFLEIVPFADALFVNETEARGLTGRSGVDAIEALVQMGVKQVVLTLGREGALLGSKDETVAVPAAYVDVVDVTGAGDCFEGVAVGSALRRGTIIDVAALHHARRAAAHTIRAVGASRSFPSPEELHEILSDRSAV